MSPSAQLAALESRVRPCMTASDLDALVALNDPRLERLIRAAETDLDREIEHLVLDAQRLIAAIRSRHARPRTAVEIADADDITGSVNVRLIAKLRAVTVSPDDAIRDLEHYIATVTYNAINDQLRRRFPQRTRLKNRLRHALTSDPRLGLWSVRKVLVGGLSAWR